MKKREFLLTSVFLLMLILHFVECDFFRVQKLRNRSNSRLQLESRSSQRVTNYSNRKRFQLPDQKRVDVRDNSLRRYEAVPTAKIVRNAFKSFDVSNREIRRINKENRKTFRISEHGRITPEIEESYFRKAFSKSMKPEREMISLKNNRRIYSRNGDRISDNRRQENSRISFLSNTQTQYARKYNRDMVDSTKNSLLRQTIRFDPNYGREANRKTFRNNDSLFLNENRRKDSRHNLLSKRSSDLKRNSFEFQSRILAREIAREREGVMMKTKRELKILYKTNNLNRKSISPEKHVFRNRIIAKRFSESRYRRGLNAVTEERVTEQRSSRNHILGKNSNLSARTSRETYNSRVFRFDKSRRELTLSPNSQNKFTLYSRKNERGSKSLSNVRASRMVNAIVSRSSRKIENYRLQGRENKYSVKDASLTATIVRDYRRIAKYSRDIRNIQSYGLSERASRNSVNRRLSTDATDSTNRRLSKNIRSRIDDKELTNRQTVRNIRNNRDSRSFERISLDIRSTSQRFITVLKHVLSTSRNVNERRQNSERSRRTSRRDYNSLSRNSKLIHKNTEREILSFRKISNPAESRTKRLRVDPMKDKLPLSSRRSQTRSQSFLPLSHHLETNRRVEHLYRAYSPSRTSRRVGTAYEEITGSSRDVQRNVRSKMSRASRFVRNIRVEFSEKLRVSSLGKSSDQDGRLPNSFSRDRRVTRMNSRFVEPLQAGIKQSTISEEDIIKEKTDSKASSLFEIISELMLHVIKRDNKYVSFAFDSLFGLLFLVILMDEPNKGLFSRFKNHFDGGFRVFQNWSIKT